MLSLKRGFHPEGVTCGKGSVLVPAPGEACLFSAPQRQRHNRLCQSLRLIDDAAAIYNASAAAAAATTSRPTSNCP